LTDYELAYHDKVLTAHINTKDDRDNERNAWADDIEKEDAEAERRKLEGSGCACILS